jgi:localization factor PodJL
MWPLLLSTALAAPTCPVAPDAMLDTARQSGMKQAYADACVCGSPDACAEWAIHPEHTEADLVVAALAAGSLCGTSSTPACATLASNATLADVEQQCAAGQAARCAEAGVRWRDGKGVTADLERAKQWFRAACVGGYWFACNDLTVMGDPLGEKLSVAKFLAECDRGSASSCYWAGARISSGFMGTPRDEARGKALLQKSCDGGYGTGCYSLGWPLLLADPPDVDNYLRLLDLGCKGGSPDACSELALPVEEFDAACKDGPTGNPYCELARRKKAGDWPAGK